MNRRDQILKKRGHSRRLISVLLALVMLLSLLPTAVFAADPAPQTYKKVTQAPEDWSGTYLIVSEGDKVALDSSLTTIDAVNDYKAVEISEGAIETTEAIAVTIEKMSDGNYSIKGANGKYIYQTSDANGLKTGDKATANTITLNADGTVNIVSGGAYLRFNAASNQMRFRYFKSATYTKQQAITLYKLDAAPARQSGIVTDLATLQDGDTVVIFNPVYKKTLSTEYSGFYNKGTDVTLAEGKLDGFTDVDKWTVGINDDGTYSFANADDKKLSMDTGYTSTPVGKVNDSWKISAVDGKDATFYIDNATRTDKYRLQWYASKGTWSAYTGTGDAFEQQIYLVIDSGSETPDPEPEPTALFKDGDKVVIYNPANSKALSSEYSGFYNKGTDVTVTGGKVAGYTKADVWTVGVNADGTYTFSTADGKKLSMDASYGSTPLDKVNTAWAIEKAATDGCYYIKNAVRGNYLEWYADKGNWSSYSRISDEALFAQAFFKVRESGIVTSLSDGDTVVIFNPANGKALSSEYSGFYNKGTDVTIADGKLTGYTKADIWTVGVNADGTYTFSTADGKKLSMDTSYGSTPLDKANTAWTIENAKTADCFYIKNNVRGNYLEWYADKGNWSSYSRISDEALFAQQFYLVVDDGGSDPEPPTPTGPLTVGSQVVIYNQNAQAVLAAQNDNESSPAINKAAATIEDGKAVCANGAVVFTVEQNGEYYRFRNDTYGYLCANGTGNNAFYTQTASDDADWLVRTCSGGVGGYEMEHRTAKYSGHSQWLEYFSDSFKVYSMYSSTGQLDYTIYSFSFYPVAEGTQTVDGIVNTPAVDFGTVAPAYVGQDYELTFTVDAPFGVQGDMTAALNGTALTVTKGEDGTYTVTIPAALVAGDTLTVTVSGKDTKGTAISGTAVIPVKNEPVFSDPKPAKAAQTGDDKRPAISVALANAGDNPTITMTVNGEAVTAAYENGRVTYTPAANMADGRVDVKVTAARTDGKTAEFSWFFTVGKTTYQLYFGQLHGHTQYSDGAGTLSAALDYIKNIPDSANVQFVAFTDHSNYFDSKNNPNVEGALYDASLVKDSDTSHSWKTYKDTIAAFNAANSGSMVALGGFEMTWSGGPGHINTFNTPGVVSRNNTTLNNKTDDAGMKAYYALLSQSEGANSISQFNHPGTTFGNFKDFSYWNPVIDSRMYMVEVGNGEGQIGAGGYYPSYEQYIMALDKGWHLAPTNNQDNHKGKWGNANDARDVILTDDFSEQGIYEAIRALRMYATEDKNLELTYTVNGLMMGSSITEIPDKLNVEVTVNDPDASDSIAKVEVVANSGKVAYT